MVTIPPIVKSIARWLLVVAMIGVGIAHFTDHAKFVATMPAYLPMHGELVWISGFFEILGGIGLAIPRTRRWAGWGLIALYICVFPANVNMAINGIPMGDLDTPNWMLWARLPFQLMFIGWAYWVSQLDPVISSENGEGS